MPKHKPDDDEWLPLPHEKPKPKNFALLQARKKKFKRKARVVVKCDICGRNLTSKDQMYQHRRTHGIACSALGLHILINT